MHLFRSLAIAISMYSKIPVPIVEWSEKNMKYAMCFFPVVGAVTGALQLLIGRILLEYTACGKLFFAIAMALIPVIVTGGIHLDGFADTVDALSSYGDREKKLQILKDPHTGAFAVIGLCVYFLADIALWSEVTGELLPVIACSYMLSRSLSGISVVSFQAAKNSGLLKTFQDGAQKLRVKQAVIMILAALLAFLYYYWMSRKQFGGTTGDLAGYFLQICELAMLAGAVLSRGIG